MKLGEALTLRARQAQKLHDLKGRVASNCLVQEGDTPSEDVMDLLGQYGVLSQEHADLVRAITLANVSSKTIDLIIRREHLRRQVSVFRAAVSAATTSPYSYSRAEIKWVPQIDVTATQRSIDALEEELNGVDIELQTRNWEVDVA